MYFEKLTDEDFEAFLSEGVILNYFRKKLKDITHRDDLTFIKIVKRQKKGKNNK